MSIYLAEFLGTFFLILIGGGVVAGVVLNKSKSKNAGWNTIVFAWGLAVTFAIYAFGGISGAHINPAVTLSFAFVGEFPWEKVSGYIIAQILGAFSGGVLVWIFYIPHWSKTEDTASKLAVFSTTPSIRSYIHNFVSEMIGTAVLIFSLMVIGTHEFTQGLNPLVVGGLIILIGLALGGTTGFAINPARDLGPRIAHYLLPIKGKGSSDWNYSLIPIFGPILGGLLGGAFFKVVYDKEYHMQFILVILIALIILFFAMLRGINSDKIE